MQLCPKGILCDARFQGLFHGLATRFTHCHRCAHQFELFLGFNGTCMFRNRFTVDQFQPLFTQRIGCDEREPVNSKAHISTPMTAHEIVDLLSKQFRPGLTVITRCEKIEPRDRSIIIDSWQPFSEMRMICIVKQNNRAILCNKNTAGFVVRAPDLHVSGIRCVAGIDLIEQQQPSNICQCHLLAQAPQSILTYGVEIDGCLGVFHCTVLTIFTGPLCSRNRFNWHEQKLL